ncbi:hypothetical protein AB1Y20_002600 [Prymnesium parvum]|uniref:AB hydrolase-1 domain-containing protein n=1 Tax=Prymnesium parvum TaxID=97485 RepID=A0AB34JC93_PRYPA
MESVEVGELLYGAPSPQVRLTFAQAGAREPDAPAVLLLPGLWGTAHSLAPLLHAIGRTRRAVALTYRGFEGELRVHSSAERAYEVHALVTRLGLRDVTFVGHHDGAEVALLATALLPGRVRALVLWNADRTGGHLAACRALAAAIGESTDELPQLLSDDDRLFAAARALCATRSGGAEAAEPWWKAVRMSPPGTLRSTLRKALAGSDTRLLSSVRALHEIPVLLLRSKRDPSTDESEAIAFRALCVAKGSKYVELHGAGPDGLCSHAAQASLLIDQFLRADEMREKAAPPPIVTRSEQQVELILGSLSAHQLKPICHTVGLPVPSLVGRGNDSAAAAAMVRALMSTPAFVESMRTPTVADLEEARKKAEAWREEVLSRGVAALKEARERHMANEVSQRIGLLLPSAQSIRDRLKGDLRNLSRTGLSYTPNQQLVEECEARWQNWLKEIESRESVVKIQEMCSKSL